MCMHVLTVSMISRQGYNVYMSADYVHVVQESVRVTHNRDIVPSVPPQYVGFHHVAREVWQLDGEQYFGTKVYMPWVCDGSGEDPVCHNSVCFLGLCTSIADHMQYLGAHMFHSHTTPC